MRSMHLQSGDEQRMILMGLKRFTKAEPFNIKGSQEKHC